MEAFLNSSANMTTQKILKTETPIRILFVSTHSPEGPDYGARLRSRHISELLSRLGEVTVVIAGAYEKYVPSTIPKPSVLKPSAIVPYQAWRIKWGMERLRFEFSGRNMNFHGVGASDADCLKMQEMVAKHDLVWLHGLRIANGFKQWHWPKSILDIDDIPSGYYTSILNQASGIKQKLRALRQIKIWKRHEALIFDRFDSMAVCSTEDHAHFGKSDRVFVVPNGFDIPTDPPARIRANPVRLGFVGTLEYAPNVNGLRWFIREVWPSLQKKIPGAVLRVMGKHSESPEWRATKNVEGLGWVENADLEMASWALTVVPIFEGGGTRVKISNAFSRKCPVVSTTLGAHGYDIQHDRELLLADSPADFATACERLITQPDEASRLANTAWESFLKKWTWDANIPRLQKIIKSTLDRQKKHEAKSKT